MKKLSFYLVIVLCFVGLSPKIQGQDSFVETGTSASGIGLDIEDFTMDSVSYNPKEDFSLSAFPLVFFLPETGLAFGGVGLMVFNAGKTKAFRKSQIQLGLAYTLKNQILIFIPYEIYIGDRWKVNGELGYYRYFYNYYGIGIDSRDKDLEIYYANFPRFIGIASYRVTESILIGAQYKFDHFDIPQVDSLLALDNPIGIEGGTISTIGINLAFDTRDDIFYPSEGWNINFTAENAGSYTFADYSYTLFQLDASYYQKVTENHIIAANIFTGTSVGDLPFFGYYYLSSGKRARGYNDRRFIDKHIALAQLEYRFSIYKRFRGVAFCSSGTVSDQYSSIFFSPQRFSYGLGFRYQLSKKQKSNIRLDLANSFEGFQFYLTIGEAF